MQLFPYQEEGAFRLATEDGYLADEPGLGKSAQAVHAADLVKAKRVLVFSPATLKDNWAREFVKFGSTHRPFHVPTTQDRLPTGPQCTIVNYDLLSNVAFHRHLISQDWDVVIGDEWHALKNPESIRTRAMLGDYGVYKRAERVWPLSGTPAPNHAGEIYPTLLRLYPQATRGLDYETWLNRYYLTQQGQYGLRVIESLPTVAELRRSIRDFFIRRYRRDVLPDLPELIVDDLILEGPDVHDLIPAETLAEYPELNALLDNVNATEEELDALDDTASATLRRYCGIAKAGAVAEQVKTELEGGLEKIVLMCWHHETMDMLHDALREYGVAQVDGRVIPSNRQKIIDQFQKTRHPTDCRVFIGQMQAAGVGNTLHAAHRMIIVEPSWVPGDNAQALLRIQRIGQDRGCIGHFAALRGTIDMAIMGSARRKAQMIAELLL